jgi:hypothetical protein
MYSAANAKAARIIFPPAKVRAERQAAEDAKSLKCSATSVRYNAEKDSIDLHMVSGDLSSIPRTDISELKDIPIDFLTSDLSLGVGGDVLCVRSWDVDISLCGLLRG